MACRRSAVRSPGSTNTGKRGARRFFWFIETTGSVGRRHPLRAASRKPFRRISSIYMNRALGWWRGQHWRGLAQLAHGLGIT